MKLKDWFASLGLKRRLASLFLTLAGVARGSPETELLAPIFEWAAATLGAVGLVHATSEGTVKKYSWASVASALASFLVAAQYIPALAPYMGLIQIVSYLMGAIGVGVAIPDLTKKKKAKKA